VKPRSLLALIGALAIAASLTLTGCDASPYAASVNGHILTQNTFNSQLKQWVGNKAFVARVQQNNATVQGDGGPGTYNLNFVANVLLYNVQGMIIHQYLQSTGQLPTQSELTAARAAEEGLAGATWYQFSLSLRQLQVQYLADQAPLTPVSGSTTNLQAAFQQIKPYLFSNLCLTQAATQTLSAAQTIATTGLVQGTPVCFEQAAMEDQPASFRDAVLELNPGQVSEPIKTAFGYEVVEVQSKDTPGFDDGVQRVLSAVLGSAPPPKVSELVQTASVKINPTYGTWSKGQINPPQLSSS
jgi:hypothetical protein